MPPPIRYAAPAQWLRYDASKVLQAVATARAAGFALATMPFQRAWIEELQQAQIASEVAGTCRMEGGELSEHELRAALAPSGASGDATFTELQHQARATAGAYRWMAALDPDRPIDRELILELQGRIVARPGEVDGRPGAFRALDRNIVFGSPPHRGAEGGEECARTVGYLLEALQGEFREHDPFVQALGLHYHLAAMHPFADGNGRTARALENLVLQRAGLRDNAFIAMSAYHHEHRAEYMTVLADVRAIGHDLTRFLIFGLRGIERRCRRLLGQVTHETHKALFRDTMTRLFGRLDSTRKEALGLRQLALLDRLLKDDALDARTLWAEIGHRYATLKSPDLAFARDITGLYELRAIDIEGIDDAVRLRVRLAWPAEITEREFFKRLERVPRGKGNAVLRAGSQP